MESDRKTGWGLMSLRLFGVGARQQPTENEDDLGDEALPFGLRSQILSQSNSVLYRALVAAIAADAVVFAKVRLADFLFVSGGGDDLKHAIKMDRKFVDFLLCDPFSMQPLVVIELSHGRAADEKPATRDPFITRALKTAGITLLKIEAQSSYPVQSLRSVLLPKISEQREAKRPGQSDSANDVNYDSVKLELEAARSKSDAVAS